MFRQVLTRDPAQLAAYGALGQLYAKQRRLPDAIAEFRSMAERDPKPVPALTMMAILMEEQGDKTAAQKQYERIVQLDPDAAVAANNLAWRYAERGSNLDLALQLARTAKRQLPNTPQVNDTLGFIYYRKGLTALAIPLLEATVEKDASNAEYRYHLGLAYGRAGNKEKASESLNRALSIDPDFEGADDARTALASLKDSK